MATSKSRMRHEIANQKRLRKKIEDLDARIIGLLGDRMRYAEKIGAIKRALGIPVYRPAVERQKLLRAEDQGRENGVDTVFVRRLMKAIFRESRRVQRAANRTNT